MALNNEFKVKNDLNTLGRILSGGTDIAQIFAASNTTWTLSANNGAFGVAGGDTLQVLGDNGVDVKVAPGTDTVRVSGINATTSVKGVASFSSDNFTVTDGVVTVKLSGIDNSELAGSITDNKLNTISTAGKVANSATTATSSNTNNAIVARGASGEFSSGNITSSGTVQAAIVNATTGFRLNNGATSGNVLRGNGTNFVSSTLAAADIASGQALTRTNDTNVTLTLGGSPTTSLLAAASLTLGWTGQLAISRGGTNASTAQGAINNLAGAVTSGQYLRGNGTNITMSAIQAGDVPTLNQNTTGSAATLTTTRTLWGQNFNGSQNVSGTLSAVGDIIGSGTITLTAGPGNNNINLRPSGTGLVTVTGNLSASNRVTARDITATNLLSTVNTFTARLSVGDVQIKTDTAGGFGTFNVFIGDSTTGRNAATGGANFVFGPSAGCSLTTGGSNNFLGSLAGEKNTSGGNNNFFGSGAGQWNSSGFNNNFFGNGAGGDNLTGRDNNFFGSIAGLANQTGSYNNFIGGSAGRFNVSGRFNNFIGSSAGCLNSSGSNNTIIGTRADVAINSLSGVIVLGADAKATQTNQIVLSTASISIKSLSGHDVGPNLFIGDSATGNNNATGNHNFVFGSCAGSALTTGRDNNFFGLYTGRSNTTGSFNNFLGWRAGYKNTTGGSNNFLGAWAGRENTTGGWNNFFGASAGQNNTTGTENNFLGSGAGFTNTVGSNNTIIGNQANVATDSLSSVIVLGTGAVATESNQIVLSTANVSFRNIGSTFEIGTPSLTDNLTVFGAVSSTGIVNTNTGFRINNGATSGHVLRGNGTNFVSSTLAAADIASGQALTRTNDTNVTLTLGGTPSTALLAAASLTLGWTGQLGLSRGGTNASTAQGAINNLAGAVTSGQYLRGNGTNVTMSAIQAADVPTLNQNTTGSAATLTTARTIAISGDLSYTSPAFNGSTNVIAAGTLATVNSNVGSFTNATVTVNAKGLVTAASSGTAPVTTVTGTSPVVSSGGTTPAISLASGYGDTQNPYASKTQKTFLAAPNAANGLPTFRTIVATDVPTLNQNTTGSAATLTTTRTLWGQNFNGSQNVSGNLTNVGDISGTAGITIYTGSSNQDITLSTSGTGEVNIAKVDIDGGSINGTTIGLTVPASAVFTGVSVTGNVTIDGSLFVSGSATQVNTTDLIVQDPIIFLAEGNLNDSVDIGFTAAYNHSLTPKRHTGLIRDHVTKEWTLFKNLSVEILSAVDIPLTDPSLQVDTLNANIKGNVEGTLTGNVSGTALKANQFTTGRIISATGDISYSSGSFDGSTNVTGTATINNDAVTTSKILDSNVTYSKIQNVQYDTILGRKTSFPVMGGGQGVVEEITCTSAARDLLDDVDAAAQRTTLGVGTTDSVTFGDVIVNNGTRSVLRDVFAQSVTSTNVLTLSTFAKANYNSAKLTVQIKQGTTRRCILEILATNDNGAWEGTVYGIVDPANIFLNVNVVSTGSTVEFPFTFNGNANYTVTASVEAISD